MRSIGMSVLRRNETYAMMNSSTNRPDNEPLWFAIKTRKVFKAEEALRDMCDEVFLPAQKKEREKGPAKLTASIPGVMFIKTSRENALRLEQESRKISDIPTPFWIYRYPNDNEIRPISEKTIELIRLLTADDTSKCEIFSQQSFRPSDRVRIKDGIFKGYTGYVKRVRRNLHVIVEIEGICMLMLPFIHPDLLEKIN